MALLITVKCDRCPTRAEFDPKKGKNFTYLIDQDGVSRAGELLLEDNSGSKGPVRPELRRVILPADWGVLELNVGHDKDVQELCPRCVELNRSFMNDPSRLLADASTEPAVALEPLPAKGETDSS